MNPYYARYHEEVKGDVGVAGGGAAGEQKSAAGVGEQKPAVVEDLSQKPTLLSGEQKSAEQKPAEVGAADQRKFLEGLAKDDAAKEVLKKSTDEQVKKLYDDAKTAEAAEAAKPVDPASYKITLPEGFTTDEALMTELKGIAAKGKIPQADLQAFMDKYAKSSLEAAKAPYKLWQDTQKAWVAEIKADKEIGGANLDANLAFGKRFLESLPNAKEVKEALDFTGAGNNPQIVKAFIAAGKLLAEGKLVQGTPGKGSGKTAAQILYPSTEK